MKHSKLRALLSEKLIRFAQPGAKPISDSDMICFLAQTLILLDTLVIRLKKVETKVGTTKDK